MKPFTARNNQRPKPPHTLPFSKLRKIMNLSPLKKENLSNEIPKPHTYVLSFPKFKDYEIYSSNYKIMNLSLSLPRSKRETTQRNIQNIQNATIFLQHSKPTQSKQQSSPSRRAGVYLSCRDDRSREKWKSAKIQSLVCPPARGRETERETASSACQRIIFVRINKVTT